VLLVEILSPGNQAKTWSNVWAYTSIPSLAEILVLHSGRIAAEILRRTPEGTWPERTEEVLEGSLTLTSIGLVINMAELYVRSGLAA
jgi:Uma2 family endonuclease